MLPLLWLAFSVPAPVVDLAPVPAMDAVVVQRLADPPRCLAARCASGEWQVGAMPAIPAGQLRIDGDDLPGAGGRLRVAAQPRKDWVKAQGSNARVGMQYGMQALKSEYASLAWAIDTGYRLQGYAEDGIAGTGPVLRGNLEWRQALGERTRLSQTTRIETGQHGTYLRNSLQLKFQLQPALTLDTGVELRRDSEVTGRNQTDAKLNLRYVF
ncbi:DUF481 domain-containing protein [Thermomonas aquatica]|jgi:hypothetical protein|uniref:DUF481 domain-containing protein n=1 Tax=Thermomonas aquatica TaxID=2202149 RepID=A0A5B7ZQY6_9GAMM|nr:DUF481 domain-containing protein [Thermomonas aquatica]QDA57189.1 DUF481 domain-containing protein [Thermomonas aquatica]